MKRTDEYTYMDGQMIISKEFHFCASHQLDFLLPDQPDHPCARLHGHNYVVRVFISGKQLYSGFILDYNKLKWFGDLLNERFDHRHLNNVLGEAVLTTAEHLALHFGEILLSAEDDPTLWAPHAYVHAIEVCETPKTCARWERFR